MGMTTNQVKLCRAVAQNNMVEAKRLAMVCCIEDTTQKNAGSIRIIKDLLSNSPIKMMLQNQEKVIL